MIDYTDVAVVSTFVRLRLLPKISCVNVWTAGGAYSVSGVCGRGRVGGGGGAVTLHDLVTIRQGSATKALFVHTDMLLERKNMPGHSLRYMYSKAPDVYTKPPGLYIYTQTPGLLVMVGSGLNTNEHSLYVNVRGMYTNIRDLYIVLRG